MLLSAALPPIVIVSTALYILFKLYSFLGVCTTNAPD